MKRDRDQHKPVGKPIKIAVYFGTFDPVNENHIALAKFTLKNYAQEVYFCPNTDNDFKQFGTLLPDRLALLTARLEAPDCSHMHVLNTHGMVMNRVGRARITQALLMEWQQKVSVPVAAYQIMGQDSFEEPGAQKALSYPNILHNLSRTLLLFPRDGYSDAVEISEVLRPYVEVVPAYKDPMEFSSTAARAAIAAGEQPAAVHPAVLACAAARGLYRPVLCSPLNTVVVLGGGPGCGKGTLAARIAMEFSMIHFSFGDMLRVALVRVCFLTFFLDIGFRE